MAASAITTRAFLGLFFVVAAHAVFSISSTVGSSMVLQRDVPTTSLWGLAPTGAVVTATLSSSTTAYNATADSNGVWRVALPAFPGSSSPVSIVFSTAGETPITISDVLFGDVLLCSGQSNMQLSVQMALNATAELAAIDAFGPMIRVLKVGGSSGAAVPQQDISPATVWARASAAGMGQTGFSGFSATCWLTGRDLYTALGGAVPVGLVLSTVGGTSIRQWSPTAALARCPQPFTSTVQYGPTPYRHSTLYNAMVAPFGTGPTAFKAVMWDQAESDSFPQTPLGYYGCATVAQINSWRALLPAPALLPWVFVHLQPYTNSGPCCLAELRAAQLEALGLPRVAYASALDLGDPTSPYGNVHFQNKQAVSVRLVQALLAVAYAAASSHSSGGGAATAAAAAAAAAYPAPAFLSQVSYMEPGNVSRIDVSFDAPQPLSLAAPENVTCPSGIPAANCSTFSLLGSDGGVYPANSTSLSANGTLLTLTASLPPGVYAVGSQYAWGAWPLASLFAAGGGPAIPGDPASLPVLPWSQGLELDGPPPSPPTVIRLQHGPSGLCLLSNASSAYPCAGGWGNSCPAFLGPCADPMAQWAVPAASLSGAEPMTLASVAVPGACINVDCDRCEAHRVAKLAACSDAVPFAFNASASQLAYVGGACAGLCLDGGEGPAVPPCEPGEFYMSEGQAQLVPCGEAAASVWSVVLEAA